MRRNSRLSVALHILLHMAQRPGQPFTSEQMAGWATTNPVVIRRTFAGLREAGIVSSAKGHGGGWLLARPAHAISVEDVQQALGERLFPPSGVESPGCVVEQAVNTVVDVVLREAERIVAARLATLSLADLAADVARLHPTFPEHPVHA